MSKKLLLNFILIAAFSAPPLTVWLTTAAAQQPAAKADSDATVERKEQKPGSIKGRVVGDDGQPMANVPVIAAPVGRAAARRPGPSGRAAQTNTDDDGVFEFEGLAPASYAISASAPGYITPPPIE